LTNKDSCGIMYRSLKKGELMIKPTYEEEAVNKITLFPHTEDEYTYLLEEHVGKAGRRIDARTIAFIMDIRSKANSESEFVSLMAKSDDFDDVAEAALDLDHKEHAGIADKLTFNQLVSAFMDAIDFRMGATESDEVQEAVKK